MVDYQTQTYILCNYVQKETHITCNKSEQFWCRYLT